MRSYEECHVEMPTEDALDKAEEYDSVDSEKEKDTITSPFEVWKEKSICINPTKCPNLFKSSPDNCPKCCITALLSEMLAILGEENSIDFVRGNDKRVLAIIVPQVKTQSGFMEQAQKLKWLDEMLEHLAGGNCD